MKNMRVLLDWMQKNEDSPVYQGNLAFDLSETVEYSFRGMLCASSGLGDFISRHDGLDPEDEEAHEDTDCQVMEFRLKNGLIGPDDEVPAEVAEFFGLTYDQIDTITSQMTQDKISNMKQAEEWVTEFIWSSDRE